VPLYSKKLEASVSGELRDSVTHDRHPADRFQCLVELFNPQLYISVIYPPVS
jgi:hypothetical protein